MRTTIGLLLILTIAVVIAIVTLPRLLPSAIATRLSSLQGNHYDGGGGHVLFWWRQDDECQAATGGCARGSFPTDSCGISSGRRKRSLRGTGHESRRSSRHSHVQVGNCRFAQERECAAKVCRRACRSQPLKWEGCILKGFLNMQGLLKTFQSNNKLGRLRRHEFRTQQFCRSIQGGR